MFCLRSYLCAEGPLDAAATPMNNDMHHFVILASYEALNLEILILLSVPKDSQSSLKIKHCPGFLHAYVSASCEDAILF